MTEREQYRLDGFVVHEGVISSAMARDLARQVEEAIDAMAAELDVSRDAYLAAVCRWSSPNPLVDGLVRAVGDLFRPAASDLLGAPVVPGRASVFRQAAQAALGTHGHQDAGYWVRPSSSRYDATTWVALDRVDERSGALRVVPGSHRGGVAPTTDYLALDFVDPAECWGAEARCLPLPAGGAVTFDPKLWHASHPARLGRARLALAIRWVPPANTAPPPKVVAHAAPLSQAFGMYTSGTFLRAALCHLGGSDVPEGPAGVRWALEQDLVAGLPDAEGARAALARLLLLLRAIEAHHAADQRGMVWERVRDLVVAPTVGLGPLP